MKTLIISLLLFILAASSVYSQTREVDGTVIDSTKLSIPGAVVKYVGSGGDSTITSADANGKFTFPAVKGPKFTLYISSLGYQGIIKHYTMDNDTKPIVLPAIILKAESNELKQVNIVASTPVTFKEDTVEYKASDYKVRENAPVEDVIKKLPGVDVDANGNVTAQGQQVTKVRINGKDFFGGDVQTATKNLPADVVESIQMIDDYGDQANLTGVKTGEPNKIMNITIRKDKNYGYFGQATAGDGSDAIPANTGTDQNRYIGLVNIFDFNDQQQIALLGNLNNTNVNTFNFSQAGAPSGGGGFGGGGGRGNAQRGGGVQTGLATTANGLTNARSIGTNYRDQWGKYISVYGSYSFNNNTTNTFGNTLQQNNNLVPSTSTQNYNEHDDPVNHRFTFNMEYKPDTINYLKLTPTFSYASTNTHETELDSSSRDLTPNLVYKSTSVSTSSAPSFGITALYNHRFKQRRNLSVNVNLNHTNTTSFDNPVYNYLLGTPTVPLNQQINTTNTTTTFGTTFSYLEPVGRVSYLELNYAFNHVYTSNNKEDDTLNTGGTLDNYSLLSNNYQYTFVTNRVGLNFRYVEKKYNYTLGVAILPAELNGESITNDESTHSSTFNIVPTAHYVYNFSRTHNLNINFDGTSTQPTFSQLQPVIDFSNALYPVQGNPDLKPSYSNNLTVRYNSFSFQTGNILFTSLRFTQTDDQIVSNTVTYPEKFSHAVLAAASPAEKTELGHLQNTNVTEYLNASGYYNGQFNFTYAKPWENRRYTLLLTGNVSYTNTAVYSASVDSNNVRSADIRDIAKSLVYTPSLRFRVDITNVIDAQASGTYSVSNTTNSISNPIFNENNNIRALTLALQGKNYVWKDWTFSYDYSKVYNYGYASTIKVTNPNVLNVYVERRFMKDYRGTIRLSAFDLFNENTGFSTTTNGAIVTQTNVNRLGRYYLATFTYRLQKFAGKAPSQNDRQRRGYGGPGGGGPGGGPPGGGGPGF
jgi:hypothetical protein